MRVERTGLCVAAAVILGILPDCADAGMLVTQWVLDSFVIGPHTTSAAHFSTVQNPFAQSHEATLGESRSHSAYDFGWNSDGGTFLISVDQHAVEVSGGSVFARASGYIEFRTTVEMEATISIAYTYDLPGYLMQSNQTVEVFGPPGQPDYVQLANYIGPTTDGPVVGTFQDTHQGIIPANCSCEFQYDAFVSTTVASGASADGSGYMSLTLTPVPEPANVGLIMVLLLSARQISRRA